MTLDDASKLVAEATFASVKTKMERVRQELRVASMATREIDDTLRTEATNATGEAREVIQDVEDVVFRAIRSIEQAIAALDVAVGRTQRGVDSSKERTTA